MNKNNKPIDYRIKFDDEDLKNIAYETQPISDKLRVRLWDIGDAWNIEYVHSPDAIGYRKTEPTPIQRQIEMAVTNGRGYLESDQIRISSLQLRLKMEKNVKEKNLGGYIKFENTLPTPAKFLNFTIDEVNRRPIQELKLVYTGYFERLGRARSVRPEKK